MQLQLQTRALRPQPRPALDEEVGGASSRQDVVQVKSGVELTKTTILRICATRDRSPTRSMIVASRFSATARTAWTTLFCGEVRAELPGMDRGGVVKAPVAREKDRDYRY